MKTSGVIKYLLIGLLVTGIAGAEVFHELAGSDASGGAVCMGPQGLKDTLRDMIIQHMQSH